MRLLREIRDRIRQAAIRAGRDPADIQLVGVAKGQPVDIIVEAVSAGLMDIGENYAQEFLRHVEEIPPGTEPIRWHFVGHLQKNKVRQIIDRVELIHSVDGIPLAEEINRRAGSIGKIQKILIEVNLGGEGSKTGAGPEEVDDLLRACSCLPNVDVQGFMVIPPLIEDPEKVRPFFRELREIRDAINREKRYRHPLKHLSMGMTSDFEVAIEEGATMVRIGTALFGERQSKK